MRKQSKSVCAGMMMSVVGFAAAALSILFSAGLAQAAPPNMLDNNLHVVDLTDLKSPLPLDAVSATQILWRSEEWEHPSMGNPDWPDGGRDTVGYPAIIQNTHGQNQDGKYYLYYAHHDAPSGIGCAVSNTIDGVYTKLADLPGSTRTDSQVLKNEHYHYPPTPPSQYEPAHYSSPSVVWNQDENKWFMYFHYWNHHHNSWKYSSSHPGDGMQMTAVATCPDLSQNVWTSYKDSAYSGLSSYNLVPVLPTTDETWSKEASSYHSIQQLPNGQWLGFLRGTPDDGTPTELGFATSSDGTNWTMPTGSVIHQDDGGGGRDGVYRPGFVGYLGENGDGDAEYLVAWSESHAYDSGTALIYGTTTDFVNFTRDSRGYVNFQTWDGAISAWREEDYLYLFAGKSIYKLELDVTPEPATMTLLFLGGVLVLTRRRPLRRSAGYDRQNSLPG